MIRYQETIGKHAISIQEGKNFGKVIDGFVNIKYLTFDGFVISNKDDVFLPFNEIKNIGDSIVFSSGASLLPLSEKINTDLRKAHSIIGLKIITEKGLNALPHDKAVEIAYQLATLGDGSGYVRKQKEGLAKPNGGAKDKEIDILTEISNLDPKDEKYEDKMKALHSKLMQK